MKTKDLSLASIVWLSLLAACAAQAAENPSSPDLIGPYRIAGIAVDAKTGYPLARARVTITEARNERNIQAFITSDDGHFEFHAKVGKFSLQAAKRGYILSAYNQHDQFWTAIVTGADVDTEHLELRVTPSAVLTGRVIDETGEPVRAAAIAVFREDRYSGVSRIRRVRSAQTDDRGVYEVPRLDKGTYFVSAQARPWYAVNPSSSTDGSPSQVDTSLDVAYPVTYYGDVAEADEAVPIPILAGDHLQADIHLNPLPALHLLFHFPENNERGLTVPELSRVAFDEVEGVPNRGVRQVSPGVYEITGIPAGRYMVRMPDSDGSLQAPMAVNLSGSQELTGSSGSSTGQVLLKVKVAGETSLPEQLQIGLRNSKGRINVTPVDEKGEAEFQDILPGKYDVVAGSPSTSYSVDTMSGESGALPGHSFQLSPGSSLKIAVTLQGGSIRIDGTAKSAGKPAGGAMIVLVPNDPEANQDGFRRDQSDLDGTFSLYNVTPGSYTVVAIEDGWDLDWSKAAVLARYIRAGQKVVVSPRTTGTQHLPKPVEVQAK